MAGHLEFVKWIVSIRRWAVSSYFWRPVTVVVFLLDPHGLLSYLVKTNDYLI